eukprot:scaffold1562_cov93-Skeletonema_dohrnii-CCMP3373.AAC.12
MNNNHGGIGDRAKIADMPRHKKELLQTAATLDTTMNRQQQHSQRGHQRTCLALNNELVPLFPPCLPGQCATFCLSNNFQLHAEEDGQARRGECPKRTVPHPLYGGIQLSPLRLRLEYLAFSYHPCTSTCITTALFASMRRPLLFLPTALYPYHGLSGVTCLGAISRSAEQNERSRVNRDIRLFVRPPVAF